VSILLDFFSLLLVIFGGYLALGILRYLSNWSQRRTVQFAILAMPLMMLSVDMCMLSASSWKSLPAMILALAMGAVALSAFVLGIVRLILMAQIVTYRGLPASPEFQMLVHDLARQFNAKKPRVLFYEYNRPLALTCGIFQPTILLSSWMVEHLDQYELEAVLAHELEHVARRDYLVIWLATMLRDAFFYVPTSWVAYRQLQQEKELACDDMAIGATRRPLALASALAKVWLHAAEGPRFPQFSIAQPLVGVSESINGRIERLLDPPEPTKSTLHRQRGTSSVSIPAVGLLILEAANGILLLALMGCGPTLPLGKLF